MLSSVDDVDAAGQPLGRIADTLSLEVVHAIVLAVAVASLGADDQLADCRQLRLLLHAVDIDCELHAVVVGLEPAREAAETALLRVRVIDVALIEEIASYEVVVAIEDRSPVFRESPFARDIVLCSVRVEGADESTVGRDGSRFFESASSSSARPCR